MRGLSSKSEEVKAPTVQDRERKVSRILCPGGQDRIVRSGLGLDLHHLSSITLSAPRFHNRCLLRTSGPRASHCTLARHHRQANKTNRKLGRKVHTMRTATPLKGLSIMPKALTLRIKRGITLPHILTQRLIVMDTLRPAHNLLPAHKEVVAVAEIRVAWVRVRVKGADTAWEFIHGEEVGGVFVGD